MRKRIKSKVKLIFPNNNFY